MVQTITAASAQQGILSTVLNVAQGGLMVTGSATDHVVVSACEGEDEE